MVHTDRGMGAGGDPGGSPHPVLDDGVEPTDGRGLDDGIAPTDGRGDERGEGPWT